MKTKRAIPYLSMLVVLTGCSTLSWNGVYDSRTQINRGSEVKNTEACGAICAQLNPNGECGRWVEPAGEACRAHLDRGSHD